MANVDVFFDNLAMLLTSSDLTGGTWNTSLPLSNLLDRRIVRLARSTSNTSTSCQFNVNLANIPVFRRTVKCFAIVNHNAYIDATNTPFGNVQILGWNSSSKTTQYYDSGVRAIWPSNLPVDPTTGFVPLIVTFPLLTHGNAGYWEVRFTSLSGGQSTLDLGRLMLFSQQFNPALNASRPAALKYVPRKRLDESLGGTRYFERLSGKPKQARYVWDWLTEAERRKFLDIQRMADIEFEVLVCKDRALHSLSSSEWMYDIWPANVVDLQEVLHDKPTYHGGAEMQFLEIIG